ncbi:ArsR/SmtB family transcription factor [Vibrio palustris]|uniref:Biofilm growth-associated repressor n=1 Tax=Vibrio palustris TaxID=1918946 RepID=A0A1R4B4V6_9VIBR|nr:metalloregulator ArsR/SmtB family transcription factor [Vibrio palustris]SJL83952.1 Biofilm growth-associated repressor [Vibrio palustris]
MEDLQTMRAQSKEVSEWLRILAHPERLMVVYQLTSGEQGVGELLKHSALSQSAFSQHLTVLRNNHIIQARKRSQQVFYSLADNRVTDVVNTLKHVFL